MVYRIDAIGQRSGSDPRGLKPQIEEGTERERELEGDGETHTCTHAAHMYANRHANLSRDLQVWVNLQVDRSA